MKVQLPAPESGVAQPHDSYRQQQKADKNNVLWLNKALVRFAVLGPPHV
jgi:hypothetical protein